MTEIDLKVDVTKYDGVIDVFVTGVIHFSENYTKLLNQKEKYFFKFLTTKAVGVDNDTLLNIMIEWINNDPEDCGDFLELFKINGVRATEKYKFAVYTNSVSKLFKKHKAV